jgi:DNA-binding beta-propeller fold protein YncE
VSTYASGLTDPRGIAVNLSTGEVYVENAATSQLLGYSAANTQNLLVNGVSGFGIAVNPTSGNVFVADNGTSPNTGSILKVTPSGNSGTVTTVVGGFNFPASLAFSSNGNNLYVGQNNVGTNLDEFTYNSGTGNYDNIGVVGTGLPYDGLTIGPTQVPEPSGMMLVGAASLLLMRRRRK